MPSIVKAGVWALSLIDAGWNPSLIPGCKFYYEAGLEATPAGGPLIQTWGDQTSNNNDVTQPTAINRLTWNASAPAFGNQPSLVSTATTQLRATAPASFYRWTSDGTGMSFVHVGRRTNNGSAQWVMGTLGAGGATRGAALIGISGSNNLRFAVGNGAAAVINVDSLGNEYSLNNPHIAIATYRSGPNPDAVLYIDGVQVNTGNETAAPSALDPVAPLCVSGRGDAILNGLIGDHVMVAGYNRVLSSDERALIMTYKSVKWGF